MSKIARVLIVLATMAGLTSLAAPAMAISYSSVSLSSGQTKVTSSSGKTLHVYLSANKETTSGVTRPATLAVYLFTGTLFGAGESHGWSFGITRSSFTYSKGTGKVSVGSQISPYGTMNLTFTKGSQKTTKCSISGSVTTVHGTLHGAMHFNSRTSAWGKVGANKFTFVTPNTITIVNNCNSGEATATCFRALTWSGPGTGTASQQTQDSGSVFTTASGASTSRITASRNVVLGSPSGASRTDYLSAAEPKPTLTSAGGLSITTRSTGPISGRASLTTGTASTSTSACKESGKTKHQHSASHVGAAWSSPSGKHLRFNFQAAPDLVVAGSGSGDWSHYTVTS